MTAAEMAEIIGSYGKLRMEHIIVDIRIEDARINFGRLEVLISPFHGEGTQWVAYDRVRPMV